MDYQTQYNQKLVTADEAVKVIKSGDWVDYAWTTGMQRWQQEQMSWKM